MSAPSLLKFAERAFYGAFLEELEKIAALTSEEETSLKELRQHYNKLQTVPSTPEISAEMRQHVERLKHYKLKAKGEVDTLPGWVTNLKEAVPEDVIKTNRTPGSSGGAGSRRPHWSDAWQDDTQSERSSGASSSGGSAGRRPHEADPGHYRDTGAHRAEGARNAPKERPWPRWTPETDKEHAAQQDAWYARHRAEGERHRQEWHPNSAARPKWGTGQSPDEYEAKVRAWRQKAGQSAHDYSAHVDRGEQAYWHKAEDATAKVQHSFQEQLHKAKAAREEARRAREETHASFWKAHHEREKAHRTQWNSNPAVHPKTEADFAAHMGAFQKANRRDKRIRNIVAAGTIGLAATGIGLEAYHAYKSEKMHQAQKKRREKEKLLKGGMPKAAFATSQYSDALNPVISSGASVLPPFKKPQLRAAIPKLAASAPTRGGFLMASDVPPFQAPNLGKAIQKTSDGMPDDVTFNASDFRPANLLKKRANITTPESQLRASQAPPEIKMPSGPSIADISKAKGPGFGGPLPGANKTRVGGFVSPGYK